MDTKKTLILIGFILVGIIIYAFLGFFIFEISVLLLVAHIILSIMYVKKKYHRKYLYFMFLFLILGTLLILINFPDCHRTNKQLGTINSCECIGVKKSRDLFSSECIGIRTECYTYYEDLQKENPIASKTLVACTEFD